ncbi:MAG: glycosyltransferase [Planctomycetes bacterium]|nr:glycosyltransferase [Planctomycetota bacterium]
MFIASISLLLCLAGWLLVLARAILSLRAHREFQRFGLPDAPAEWPRVSILVPARNEEEILETSLRSLLALDYPDFEVLLVNDHSTDRTGEIARRIAAEDNRLRVIEAADLPPGWVGKPWALHQAAQAARGDWLLMTDADILHRPNSVRKAMGFALARRIDLFSLLPGLDCESFWERVVLPPIGLLFAALFPVYRCNDPRSNLVLAAGAFILVRTRVYQDVGGHESIRNEMVDDVGIGRQVKRRGYKIWLAYDEGLVRTRMYSSLAEIWEGFSKNFYPASNFSAPKMLGGMFLWTSMVLLPPAFLCVGPSAGIPFVLAAAVTGLMAILYAGTLLQFRLPVRHVFTLPLGTVMLHAIAFSSFYRYRFGRGLAWKGRTYANLEEPPTR